MSAGVGAFPRDEPHLHLVLEDEGVAARAAVSPQLAQDDAVFEEEDLPLVPSGGRLHFWILLPHCEDSLWGGGWG